MVDTNRLKIISSIELSFRDESHLYLELGGDAYLPLECPKEPTIQGAPKWFHSLPQDGDSEYESSYGHRIRYWGFTHSLLEVAKKRNKCEAIALLK